MKKQNRKNEIKIDAATVEKIKTLQSLPEEVVINFLKSKGSLASSDFKNKFTANAE